MDPNYNKWAPQGYSNGQYAPYEQPRQPNGYQFQQLPQPQQQPQHSYPPQYQQQYAPMPVQTLQGYPQPQQYHGYPQATPPRQSSQHYSQMAMQMPQQMPQQMQMQLNHEQQMRPHAQPQAAIPARAPNSTPSTPMQMQPPRIRQVQVQVQVPVQRTSNTMAQMDGAGEKQRRYSSQQSTAPPVTKPVERSQSHQENTPRPQQRPMSTPTQKHSQHRTPLQPHSAPQQPAASHLQTPVKQARPPSIQDPSPKPRSHPKVVISKPSSHQLTPTKHVHAQRKQLPADLSVLLLSAADEYITAARGMSAIIVRDKKEVDIQQYQKLMATAMGCMDTVLKGFNILPRDEAKLRLRYAGLLIEETTNETAIEEILSKQMSLCGRFRLHDLKYATCHLQARYHSKTNHRAAIKSLAKPINEAETFQHIPWVYALRFLKIALILQAPGRIEAVRALQQLNAISAHAQKFGDRAIYVACCALEAMVHLRSGAADRLEQTQRAVAAARSLQLEVSATQLGSFGTLIDLIDIACGVQQGTPNHSKQAALDEFMTGESGQSAKIDAGVFAVCIEKSFGGGMTSDTGGIFQRSADGRDELLFSWLPLQELQALCFYVSALDQAVHQKGFEYIAEAHQRSREAMRRQTAFGVPIHIAQAQADWIQFLDWQNMFTLGLMSSSRDQQSKAQDARSVLRGRVAKPPYNNEEPFTRSLSYLSAVIDQNEGALGSALVSYSSDELALPQGTPPPGSKLDFSILAAFNRYLIVQDPAHPEHHTGNALMTILQPLSDNHVNQYIRTAFRVLNGIRSENVPIARQKTQMQAASNRARDVYTATQNVEFVIMALSMLTSRYFIDSPSWEKAVHATRVISKRSGKPLWIAVASGQRMIAYQQNGQLDKAREAQADYESVRHQLPPALRGEQEEDIDAEGDEDEG
ncbi:hypothetical protein T440DRAFT_464491 [Plenodomus tracheiphilus IPT5]|uniref:75k gamma secalin n=1 Tax=Plenodomus tracheiphilus IPT5 TaxID=1408161 RepID=A0A6A7BI57_9PLEO|nr:hypothetical protein T440DRAFT_464491 [Plenodomus tracheiphilus IPT5]